MKRLLAVALMVLWSHNAHAHLVSTRFGELYSGLLHPMLALEHVVPWLALGLLGALAGRTTSRWAVLTFPLSVLAGVLLAAAAPAASLTDMANLGSFVLLGGLVAANVSLSPTLFVPLVILLGLSHGYGNSAEELSGKDLLLYAIGVALAAYLTVTLVTAGAFALARERRWGNIAVRAAGSWVLAIGLVFGGFSALVST